MRNFIVCVLAILLVGIASQVSAKDRLSPNFDSVAVIQEIDATQRDIDSATAPIKSAADLQRYLRNTQVSPLSKLPPKVRDNFIRSLVFTNGGLASYSYLGMDAVSATDLYAIFSLFGQQRSLSVIPGLKARNELENSILFMSTMGGGENHVEDPPVQNAYCTVDGQDSWCAYEFGSACNAKCK